MIRVSAHTPTVLSVAVIKLWGVSGVRVIRTFVAVRASVLAVGIVYSISFVGATSAVRVVDAVNVVRAGCLSS